MHKDCSDDTGRQWPVVCNAALNITKKCRASWCTDHWCYVDPCNCASPDLGGPSSWFAPQATLFYSYKTCGADDSGWEASGNSGDGVVGVKDKIPYKCNGNDGCKCISIVPPVPLIHNCSVKQNKNGTCINGTG